METTPDEPLTAVRTRLGQSVRRVRDAVSPLTVAATGIALALLSPVVWLVLEVVIAARTDGYDWVVSLLVSADTVGVIVNSLVLTAAVTVGSILVGVPLAVLTVQTDLPFRRFWSVVSALPLVIPSYIGAFAFVSAFGPRGVLQDMLAPLGIQELPAVYGLGGTTLVLTLYTYPYVYLTTRASLLAFDGTVVEAARTLNASRWEAFKRVTLPQIEPGIAAGSLLVALYTLSDFGTPVIMRYSVFTRKIYIWYQNFHLGRAALLSLMLVVLTGGILLWESRINASREGAHVASTSKQAGTITLGHWKWPALGFCATIALLGLAVPIGILFMWLGRPSPGYAEGGFQFELSYVTNTVGVAATAAAVAVFVGLPLAYLSARGDSRLASLPERASYVGYAMPGLVVGLSLIFFGLRYVNFLYETLIGSIVLLVFAYIVRFVPQAVGIMESSILQVDPKHAEAARTMGESSFRSFRRVVLPQIAPGIISGGALVFLTTMKELPATLLLRPLEGGHTIVTYIWLVQEAAYYGQSAVPALILVGVSALSMLIILAQEKYNAT